MRITFFAIINEINSILNLIQYIFIVTIFFIITITLLLQLRYSKNSK